MNAHAAHRTPLFASSNQKNFRMQFALVNAVKTRPQPKLRGTCPHCGSEMMSRCGRVKVWHWAHKRNPHCDRWWESETQWHRDWKNCFPVEWQEVSHTDPSTNEIHIADVKNPFGLVIEFQHSRIKPAERESRENFYSEMVWVVDGLRGELDESWFNMGLGRSPIQNSPLAYGFEWWGRSRLMHDWSQSKCKVYLDFGKDHLWRLVLFDPKTKKGAVGPIAKTAFIDDCMNGTYIHVSEMVDEQPADSTANGK